MKADTETLAGELLLTTRSIDMRSNPFLVALAAGTASRDAIRRYAIGTYLLAHFFPQRLAALMSICDDAAIRLELLRNLLEEDGVIALDGDRPVRDPERSHGAIARRFCLLAGATDDDLAAARAADARNTWVDQALAQGRLAASLAYLTVGVEGCVSATHRLLIPILQERYGFSAGDLEFFILHAGADAEHARTGAAMTASVVRSDEDRVAALDGARRATRAWWWWHRSFAR